MAQPTRRDLDVAITALSRVAYELLHYESTLKTMLTDFWPDLTDEELSNSLRAVQGYLEGWSEYGRG